MNSHKKIFLFCSKQCSLWKQSRLVLILPLSDTFNLAGLDINVEWVLLSCQNFQTTCLVSSDVVILKLFVGFFLSNTSGSSNLWTKRSITSSWSGVFVMPSCSKVYIIFVTALLHRFLVFGVIGKSKEDSDTLPSSKVL